MTTEVFVISAIRLHRESLAGALDADANVSVLGQAATLEEAFAQLRDLGRSAVVLLDAPLPADVDLPLAPEPEAKVVAVGVPEDEAVGWIEAGISGFLPPEATLDETIAALESVAKGHLEASPQVTAHLASRIRGLAAESPELAAEQLTSREAEVLELIVEGLSNKEIGRRLSIQEQTVKNHVHHVLGKMGVNRRAEAAARTRNRRRPPGSFLPGTGTSRRTYRYS